MAQDLARELGAKIVGVELDGGHQRYDAAHGYLRRQLCHLTTASATRNRL